MGAQRTRLANGTTVVSEAGGGVASVAFGLYFAAGSRFESVRDNGISHLLEHLVFKGSARRTGEEVNREIDLLGGQANAFTSKEAVCFHNTVLAEHLERALSLYSELVTECLPEGIESELDRERSVVLQEISAAEDVPEERVGDLADRSFFGDHPLALPVVGSAAAVARLDLAALRRHAGASLVRDTLVVSAAGRVDHEWLVARVQDTLAALPAATLNQAQAPPTPCARTRIVERDLEQVQLCLSARGVARDDPRRIAAEVLSCVVGEGCSSRLFREVRDRRGLAYSVGSALACYSDAGSWNLWAAMAPEKLAATLDVIRQVLAELRDSGISAAELEAAREHLRTSWILGCESPAGRMAHLADQALIGAPRLGLGETLTAIGQVERETLHELAREWLDGRLAVAAVGPVPHGVLPEGGWELGG
ncbi:MAG: M16 family metallopeptidase [Myxococcota bacterium]